MERHGTSFFSSQAIQDPGNSVQLSGKEDGGFTFPVADDEDEVTESKIRAFLDEKVLISRILYIFVYDNEINLI